MGNVIIMEDTTIKPITAIGKYAGICWNGKDTNNLNYKRGVDCINSNHGRTLEYPQIYMTLNNYSARVIREFYTHIGGSPTRLQSSTRYIDYEHGFDIVVPPEIKNNDEAWEEFCKAKRQIEQSLLALDNLGIKKEDSAMLLPLGMTTKVVVRTNLRNLIDMSHQRLCNRAYWEYNKLMKNIIKELALYSNEWRDICDMGVFAPKCKFLGYCNEKNSCGKRM